MGPLQDLVKPCQPTTFSHTNPPNISEIGTATKSYTVKPVLSGHPWGIVKYPLNTGCPLNTGTVYSHLTGELIFGILTSVRLIQGVHLIQGRLIQV